MAGNTIRKMISDEIGINIGESNENPEAKALLETLTILPSVYEKAKKKCASLGISLNDVINQFLESWVEE